MSRIPRRSRVPQVPRRNDSLNRFKQTVKSKGSNGLQVLHSPVRNRRSKEKNLVNRCCYVAPVMKDFGQYYTDSNAKDYKDIEQQISQRTDRNQYATLLQDQYGPDSQISSTTHQKKVPSNIRNKVKSVRKSDNSPKESHWQNVHSVDEVDKLMSSESSGNSRLGNVIPSKNIFISKVPHVKVIAEKFSKYKRGNLELRRLDEKVVCVEYDIFNKPANGADLKPRQRMRAFFSIKPHADDSYEQGLPTLPSHIKNEFDLLDEDLQKLTEKELEFIDGKIEENKSYLEDLRRILKRKHVSHAQKNKTSLDLLSLYKMAKEDRRPLNCDFSETNLLSKALLQEVKDLIIQRCTSSVHGFSRKTIKRKDNGLTMDPSVISEIITSELSR